MVGGLGNDDTVVTDLSEEEDAPTRRRPWPDDAPVLIEHSDQGMSQLVTWIRHRRGGNQDGDREVEEVKLPSFPTDWRSKINNKRHEKKAASSGCHPHRRGGVQAALKTGSPDESKKMAKGLRQILTTQFGPEQADRLAGVKTRAQAQEELAEAETVYLMAGKNYRVKAGFRSADPQRDIDDETFCIAGAVLDSGSGLSFVNAKFLRKLTDVQVYKLPAEFPVLVGANQKKLELSGVARMTVDLAGQRDDHLFLVAEALPVDVLLGAQYLAEAVEAILPQERRVRLCNGATVHLEGKENGAQPVKVAKRTLVPAHTVMTVPVTCLRSGLSFVQPGGGRKAKLKKTHAAAGLVDLPAGPGDISFIEVTNFGDRDVYLAARQTVAYAQPPPSLVAVVEGGDRSRTRDEQSIGDVDLSHLTPTQRKHMQGMLTEYEELWKSGTLGTVRGAIHRIDTQGSPPIHQQPRRAGPTQRLLEKSEVDKMLTQEVIRPSKSEWASPVVLVAKSDGTTRFCIDYRKLNTVTRKDQYPLPKLDEQIDSLGAANWFTTLDANSGYWQIPVAEADREKTAFVCHAGFYEFLRMPFGLCNAPATFQRAMDVILAGVRFDFALVYLDDIIVYSSTFEAHVKQVEKVLQLLKKAKVTLKLKKCRFAVREVEYLGHLIKPGRLEIKEANVRCLRETPFPKTKTQLRSFLGTCNVYRRFVPRFAQIAAPLSELTGSETPAELSPPTLDQCIAFESLRRALLSPEILMLPRDDRDFTVDTDASKTHLGAVLQQHDEDGKLRPVGYFSRTLTDAEKRYSATELEAAAVVWAVTTLRHYLEGRRFHIRTDHRALQWLFSASATDNPRLARFRLKLAALDFSVSYLPGRKNRAADGMSRLESRAPCNGPRSIDSCEEIPTLLIEKHLPARTGPLLETVEEWNAITVEEMDEAQQADPECQKLREALAQNEDALPCYGEDDRGLLARMSPWDYRVQVYVPKSLRERVLALSHYPKVCAHPGGSSMYANLRRDFFWPSMAGDCKAAVARCPECSRRQLRQRRRRASTLKLFMPNGPLEFVCVDILGPLPPTKNGNKFLLVMADRFSKLTRAVALPDARAETVARAFLEHWLSVYGVPLVCLSDNGSNFRSKFFQSVCGLLGIKNLFSTPYHPQTQGQVERFNRTILSKLSQYVSQSAEWDELVPALVLSYNSSVNTSTGYSPFELILTRAPTVPVLEPMFPMQREGDRVQQRARLQRHLQRNAKKAKETLKKTQERYKRNYDRAVRRRAEKLKCGDLVFVKTYSMSGSHKLVTPAAGPYTVVETDGYTVTVKTPSGDHKINADRVVRAPSVEDLPENVRYVEEEEEDSEDELKHTDNTMEYVIERLVGHKEVGPQLYLRVRWYGYAEDDDTWELWEDLPEAMVQKYWRKHELWKLYRN